MVMGPEVEFSIFSTVEISEGAHFLACTFEEGLNVRAVHRAISRDVFVIVGQSHETVLFVHLGFVHAAESPFAGSGQAARHALAAGDCYWEVVPTFFRVEYDFPARGFIGFDRACARHRRVYRRQPPRMGGAARFRRRVLWPRR